MDGRLPWLHLTDQGRIEVEEVGEPARIETGGLWWVVVAPAGAPAIDESQVEALRKALRESSRDA